MSERLKQLLPERKTDSLSSFDRTLVTLPDRLAKRIFEELAIRGVNATQI